MGNHKKTVILRSEFRQAAVRRLETQRSVLPWRLDMDNECLRRGEQAVALTPKAFAVLRYLVEHTGRLVTKEALLNAVWPDTYVSDGVLKNCILELRRALVDNAKTPQFIETVYRRGYRFITPITTAPPVSSSKSQVSSPPPTSALYAPRSTLDAPRLVGREAELAQLHRWLAKALCGERQIIFVTGEPGIGKTSVVEAFLRSLESSVQSLASEDQSRDAVQGSTFKVQSFEPTPNPQPPTPSPWIGRGQCIAHYGAGEAYLPVLEALGRICREPDGERFIELLAQQAPTWLIQMPALLNATELEALQRKVAGATRERMLREMAEAVEALTAERPLVLRLEDLHWSDYSTLDLLSFLARRQEPARLLVIGTYRPVEMLGKEHPLHAIEQELHLHKQCEELGLGLLSEAAVEEYLAVRFSSGIGAQHAAPLRKLARVIYQRTEGNPLFMVNMVDHLVAQGVLGEGEARHVASLQSLEGVQVGVPDSLRQMIEWQIERLSPQEQRLLEVASVAGAEFSAAAVAAGVETEVSEVEARCEGLARREQFLRAIGTDEWPDGTVATRYGFLHALYQEVLYERVLAGQRIELHRRIGEREEVAYGDRAREIAAELAVHFELGRDYRRAVQYLGQAGKNAVRRSANQEAISLLTKGLELLKTLPDTPERTQQELTLQIALGPPLIATKGYGVPEVGNVFARAHELCRQVGETPHLFPVLVGLYAFYMNRGQLQTARELAEQYLSLAQRLHDPLHLLESHDLLGTTLLYLGEFVPSREHLEQSVALYDFQQYRSLAVLSGRVDAGVSGLCYAAWVLWLLGYPDQALKRSHEALTLAQELAHPLSLAFALDLAAVWLYQFRREGPETQARAEALITFSTEQGFEPWTAEGIMQRGWALAEQGKGEEGIEQMHEGLAAIRATGAEFERPYWLALLAEGYGTVGRTEEGLSVLAEALTLVNKTGVRFYTAELYRLKGELSLQSRSPQSAVSNPQSPTPSTQEEAEACFLKAIEIARKQQAKSLELRATVSLVRLRQQQATQPGSRTTQHEARNMLDAARNILSEIYGWFTEGFDTRDLKEAKALLVELS